MIVDKYLEIKGAKDFSKLSENVANSLFIKAGNLFNYLFSKEEKIKIEEKEDQKEIEFELQKRIDTVDFGQFFCDVGFR